MPGRPTRQKHCPACGRPLPGPYKTVTHERCAVRYYACRCGQRLRTKQPMDPESEPILTTMVTNCGRPSPNR